MTRAELEQAIELGASLLAEGTATRRVYVPDFALGENKLAAGGIFNLCPTSGSSGGIALDVRMEEEARVPGHAVAGPPAANMRAVPRPDPRTTRVASIPRSRDRRPTTSLDKRRGRRRAEITSVCNLDPAGWRSADSPAHRRNHPRRFLLRETSQLFEEHLEEPHLAVRTEFTVTLDEAIGTRIASRDVRAHIRHPARSPENEIRRCRATRDCAAGSSRSGETGADHQL